MKKNYKKIIFKTKEEWLKYRKISGSRLAMVLNQSKWGNQQTIYNQLALGQIKIKTDNNDMMKNGSIAENHIRELVKLDYKNKYSVKNPPSKAHWLFERLDKTYLHYTPDGTLKDLESGKKGILEIKYIDLIKRDVKNLWENNDLPQDYYLQALQSMIVMNDIEFVILVAYLKYYDYNEITKKFDFSYSVIRKYQIVRNDKTEELKQIETYVDKFYQKHIIEKIRPKTILSL